MEKGIYKYSPALQFGLKNIGEVYVNLATSSPTLYLEHSIYSSSSNNGLQLSLFIRDEEDSYNSIQTKYTLKFSYDMALSFNNYNNSIYVETPSGGKYRYAISDETNKYNSLEDKTYILEEYNEQTCTTGYTLIDEQKTNYQFLVNSSGSYFLNKITFPCGERITIYRDTNQRIINITNTLSKEKISFTYNSSSIVIKIFKRNSSSAYEEIYRTTLSIDSGGEQINVGQDAVTTSASFNGYVTQRYSFTDEQVILCDTQDYITFTHTFAKGNNNKITSYEDNNGNVTNISYWLKTATVTNNRNDDSMKYVWDHIGRLTHVYDNKNKIFKNTNYDSYNHVVIQSANLYMDKVKNVNYLGSGDEIYYEGKINDLISVIVDADYFNMLRFNVIVVFQYVEKDINGEDIVIKEDRVTPYNYDMETYADENSFVFSTYSNIEYNKIKIEIVEETGTGTYSFYVYNAGFTTNYIYKDKTLVGVLQYGVLNGFTAKDNKIIEASSGTPTYDENDRLINFVDVNGSEINITYDSKGNQEKVTTSYGNITNTKETIYDTYNQPVEEYDDSSSDVIIKTNYNLNGTISYQKVLSSAGTQLKQFDSEYSINTTPFISKLITTLSNSTVQEISYSYLNGNIYQIVFNNNTYSYSFNAKPNELQYFQINNRKAESYAYNSFYDGHNIFTELAKNKSYANGTYYFEYNSDYTELREIKYSSTHSSSNATSLYDFSYETINNKRVLSKINYTNQISHGSNTIQYHYDELGNLIGKTESNGFNDYSVYTNGIEKIETFNSNKMITLKELQENKKKMKFADYVRILNENIKLCNFDIEAEFDFTDENNNHIERATKVVLYNNVIDNLLDSNSDNCSINSQIGFEMYKNYNKYTYRDIDSSYFTTSRDDYVHIVSRTTLQNSVSYYVDNLCFPFSSDTNILDSKNQTISFMVKSNFFEGISYLLQLTNVNYSNSGLSNTIDVTKDLFLVLDRTSSTNGGFKVCTGSLNNNNGLQLQVCNGYNEEKNTNTDLVIHVEDYDEWHMVSLTFTPDSLTLVVDDKSMEVYIPSMTGNRNFNTLYFGFFPYLMYYCIPSTAIVAEFDLKNIMIPYKKRLSVDRLKYLFKVYSEEETRINNDLLSSSNYQSNTTMQKLLSLPDSVDMISFNKTMTSLKGVKPQIDHSISSLDFENKDKFVFDDTLNSHVYKLSGRKLTYTTPETYTYSISFKLKVNDNSETHNIIRLVGTSADIRVTKNENILSFVWCDDVTEDICSATINTSSWNDISLVHDDDNSQLKIYVNETLVATSSHYIGELAQIIVDDNNNSSSCHTNNNDCLLKNLLISIDALSQAQIEDINSFDGNTYINTQSDVSGLVKTESIFNNSNRVLSKDFSYNSKGVLSSETIYLLTGNKYSLYYSYDNYRNVTTLVTKLNNASYGNSSYTYDAKGQLVSEVVSNNNLSSGLACNYTYDDNGNIKSYSLNGTEVYSFEYDSWGRLKSYGDNSVTYVDDENNNKYLFVPATIGNDMLSWQGKRLVGINGTKNVEYQYNDKGLRTYKKDNINNIEYLYFYDLNDQLISEVRETSNDVIEIIYLYHDNYLYGFIYNGTYYYYFRDSLGNINGIIDTSGNLVVSYTYNAYGKIIDISGSLKDTIGVYNPIRYKGYYYDVETNLFLVSSRYYSPELCRWISPDDIEYLDPESVNGLNLYCYCANDPINHIDPDGHAWYHWAIGAGIIVACAALTVITAGGFAAAGAAFASVVTATMAPTALSAVFAGATIGAAAIGVAGAVIGGKTDENGFSWDNDWSWENSSKGFMIGSIAGAVIGGAWGGAHYALQNAGKMAIKTNINNLVNNPTDEFLTVGPKDGAISNYTRSINLTGDYGRISASKLQNGLYQISDGHHRIAALKRLGYRNVYFYLVK